jgi:hypothetical protein
LISWYVGASIFFCVSQQHIDGERERHFGILGKVEKIPYFSKPHRRASNKRILMTIEIKIKISEQTFNDILV